MHRTTTTGAKRLLLSLALAASAGAAANASLLTDPGFESNPVVNIITVLSDFTTFQGVWGNEVGGVVTTENGITPFQGVRMLRMDDDGLVTTQCLQVVDVSSYAALIDSGNAVASGSAWFNAASTPGFINGQGGVSVSFFSAANFGSSLGNSPVAYIGMDGDAHTWQLSSINQPIPVGTRWMFLQVAFDNSTMFGNPGYVDAAELNIVPTPGTALIAGIAGLAALRRRRA